jgi:hypothetical protein
MQFKTPQIVLATIPPLLPFRGAFGNNHAVFSTFV